MSGKKKILMVLIILLMLGAIAAGLVWNTMHYHFIDFRFYPRDAKTLDLREEDISVSHFEKIRRKLPGCEIQWNVPFQGGLVPSDAAELTVTSLTDEDLEVLGYLAQLETVHAEDCRDYAPLAWLYRARPELQVTYSVAFSDGSSYPCSAEEVELNAVAESDVPLLAYLPELKRVTLTGGGDLHTMEALRGNAASCGAEFAVRMAGQRISPEVTSVELENVTEEELALLPLLENLTTVHLHNPEASAETVLALGEQYPDRKITWDLEIGGLTFDSSAAEVDLSAVTIEDLAEVERKMTYLPDAEKLILGLCGMDNPDWGASKSKLAASQIENEDLAAYRDRVRGDYKVVWTVRLGPNIALRTDKDNFMPGHFGVGRLFNDHAYNLRYCEDMVCLDLGHMTLSDVSFLEFMPELKYLILAHTEVQYIEPIRSCKKLVWLELDWSCIRDYSPLVDCTALEDLNIGKTYADIDPICEMTWLKNLYMIYCSGRDAYTATQALPDTTVVASGNATVGGIWRKLPNYYAMRDMLGMYYMN
nr:hypothetical protein [Oscillospiraceae bacterium]